MYYTLYAYIFWKKKKKVMTLLKFEIVLSTVTKTKCGYASRRARKLPSDSMKTSWQQTYRTEYWERGKLLILVLGQSVY